MHGIILFLRKVPHFGFIDASEILNAVPNAENIADRTLFLWLQRLRSGGWTRLGVDDSVVEVKRRNSLIDVISIY